MVKFNGNVSCACDIDGETADEQSFLKFDLQETVVVSGVVKLAEIGNNK